MQIDVRTENRTGIAQEILAVTVAQKIDLSAVEVVEHHVYLQFPERDEEDLARLAEALGNVPGVHAITRIEVMPRDRRRHQISALLTAIPDPVVAVDEEANILFMNSAAMSRLVREGHKVPADLVGRPLEAITGREELSARLMATGFEQVNEDIFLAGEPWYLECRPVVEEREEASDRKREPIGGMLIFHSPARIGARLSVVQGPRAVGFDAILSSSEPMKDLIARAKRAALVNAPLMILGETGTGKELLARACHQASDRSEAPFLALNCAALPEGLAESELFGYAPGAFTSADKGGKPGLLEMAARGTLFLDEIGEMSPYLQAKLLRFLQDGTYRRVGGRSERRVDVRIVSATHRDLEAMVKEGTFREDLYYRLNVITLAVPPLRARSEDILLLAQHFIARATAQIAPEAAASPPRLSPDAAALLLESPWPGNVRQLENAIFRAVSLCDRPFLSADDFELGGSSVGIAKDVALNDVSEGPASLREGVANYERALLSRLYPQFPSSRRLAERLKVSHATIAQKLRAYGIGKTKPGD